MRARVGLMVAMSFLVACGARGGYELFEDGEGGAAASVASSSSSGGASSSSSSGVGGTGGEGVGGEGAQGGAGATGGQGGEAGQGGQGGGPLCQGLSPNASQVIAAALPNTAAATRRVSISMGANWRHTIAWQQGNGDIYAQMYEYSTPLSLPTQIFSTVQQSQPPSVIQLSNGGAVVAWTSNNDVRLRRINASGNAIGPQIAADEPNEFVNRAPALAAGGDDSFVVAYNAQFPAAIRLRKYDVNGTSLGIATATSPNEQSYGAPAVTVDGPGNIAVAWRANGNGGQQLYVQRFNTQGSQLGPRITVTNGAPLAIAPPSIDAALDGRFVVSWVDTSNQLRARLYNPDGAPTGNVIQVNAMDNVIPQEPMFGFENEPAQRIAMADTGSFLVTWTNGVSGRRSWRRFSATGAPLTSQLQDTSMLLSWAPAVAVEPCGGRSATAWVNFADGGVQRAVFGP